MKSITPESTTISGSWNLPIFVRKLGKLPQSEALHVGYDGERVARVVWQPHHTDMWGMVDFAVSAVSPATLQSLISDVRQVLLVTDTGVIAPITDQFTGKKITLSNQRQKRAPETPPIVDIDPQPQVPAQVLPDRWYDACRYAARYLYHHRSIGLSDKPKPVDKTASASVSELVGIVVDDAHFHLGKTNLLRYRDESSSFTFSLFGGDYGSVKGRHVVSNVCFALLSAAIARREGVHLAQGSTASKTNAALTEQDRHDLLALSNISHKELVPVFYRTLIEESAQPLYIVENKNKNGLVTLIQLGICLQALGIPDSIAPSAPTVERKPQTEDLRRRSSRGSYPPRRDNSPSAQGIPWDWNDRRARSYYRSELKKSYRNTVALDSAYYYTKPNVRRNYVGISPSDSRVVDHIAKTVFSGDIIEMPRALEKRGLSIAHSVALSVTNANNGIMPSDEYDEYLDTAAAVYLYNVLVPRTVDEQVDGYARQKMLVNCLDGARKASPTGVLRWTGLIKALFSQSLH